MNMLLTQFFPNNTYAAKHQSLMSNNDGGRSYNGPQKTKKKVRNFESYSPQRNQGHSLVKMNMVANGNYADGSGTKTKISNMYTT